MALGGTTLRTPVGLLMPLDECKLGGSFGGDGHVELAFLGRYLGDVDEKVANRVKSKLLLLRLVTTDVR